MEEYMVNKYIKIKSNLISSNIFDTMGLCSRDV